MHFVAGLAEDRHRQRTDPAGGTGDRQRTQPGVLAVLAQSVQGQGGGKAGGAKDHALTQVQAARQGHHPLRRQARPGRVAAVTGFGQAAAGDQHRVTLAELRVGGGGHVAGHVDPAHQREAAQDLALAGAGQRILVVDRRPLDLDHHLARRELVQRQRLDAATVAGVVVVDAEGGEGGGDGHGGACGIVGGFPILSRPARVCRADQRSALHVRLAFHLSNLMDQRSVLRLFSSIHLDATAGL